MHTTFGGRNRIIKEKHGKGKQKQETNKQTPPQKKQELKNNIKQKNKTKQNKKKKHSKRKTN